MKKRKLIVQEDISHKYAKIALEVGYLVWGVP